MDIVLLKEIKETELYNLEPFKNEMRGDIEWIDPYGWDRDIADRVNKDRTKDACTYLQGIESKSAEGILWTPPQSPSEIIELYNRMGFKKSKELTQTSYYTKEKKEIGRIVKTGGTVITLSYNSGGVGKKYGFELETVYIIPITGYSNCYYMTIERRC